MTIGFNFALRFSKSNATNVTVRQILEHTTCVGFSSKIFNTRTLQQHEAVVAFDLALRRLGPSPCATDHVVVRLENRTAPLCSARFNQTAHSFGWFNASPFAVNTSRCCFDPVGPVACDPMEMLTDRTDPPK